jgi:D-3-phosphoglycerate dehydrogenase
MSEWKILITDNIHEAGKEILREHAEVDDRRGITAEELFQVVGGYDALIVRGRTKLPRPVFEAATQLKVIGRAGIGVDNIDLAAANAHGVMVVNSPHATTIAVAEHTLALLLAMVRSIPKADAAMKSGQWIKNQLEGVEINGKVLGVIGMGAIGGAVAEKASALGMEVIGYDPLISGKDVHGHNAKPASLSEVYAQSDIITLHVPLTRETRGMIDGQALAHMKRGVRLICTARGGVIDETALLGALESGQVDGAALDVYAKEPPGMTALVTHPSVICTPHIGAQTIEAQARASVDIAQEVLAALKGEKLRWKVK